MGTIVVFLIFIWLAASYWDLKQRVSRLEKKFDVQTQHPLDTPLTKPSNLASPVIQAPPAFAPISQSSVAENSSVHIRDKVQRVAKEEDEFEFHFGSKIFTAVGLIAITFGLGFFLRYAFTHDLITEMMRVLLGFTGGFILLGLGWYTTQRYSLYGHMLTGGGLGLFYLSLYAAFNFYQLITQPVAFFGMTLITILGATLALWYDSLPLFAFSLFGGFATPFLLPTNINNPHALFIYIALLDFGILLISWKKTWPYLALGAFLATTLVYLSWFETFYTHAQFSVSFLYTSLFFIIFLSATLLNQFFRSDASREGDIILTLVVPALYFAVNLFEINLLYPDFDALFSILLGVLYGILALIFRLGDAKERFERFGIILFAVACVFFILAVPIQFERQWITIGWGAEALVLLLLGLRYHISVIRQFGYGAFALAAFQLMAFDLSASPSAPWFNDRMVAFAGSFLFFTFASIALALKQKDSAATLSSQEREEFAKAYSALVNMAYLAPLVVLSAEIFDFFDLHWLAFLWTAGGLIGSAGGLITRGVVLRVLGYSIFVLAGIRVLFLESFVPAASYVPFWNGRVGATLVFVGALGLYAALLSYYASRVSQIERANIGLALFISINGFLLWLLTIEIWDYFSKQLVGIKVNNTIQRIENMRLAAISIAWTLYAIVLLVIGIISTSKVARIASLLLFMIVVGKVFLIDTANLDDFYRFVSFISLGVVLLVSGFLYFRFKERILQFIASPQ
ncbi:MAG TPA: DUF2339 domain-containing protein [Candidatus Paceibacterota bacterium]